MQLSKKYFPFLIIITVFLFSCTGTKESIGKLPPKPDYGTRADYPNLVQGSPQLQLEGRLELMRVNEKSLNKTRIAFDILTDQNNCKGKGRIIITMVVTKEGIIDAPEILRSVSPNCDKTALEALRYLKFNNPAKIDGKKVNMLFGIPLRLQ